MNFLLKMDIGTVDDIMRDTLAEKTVLFDLREVIIEGYAVLNLAKYLIVPGEVFK